MENAARQAISSVFSTSVNSIFRVGEGAFGSVFCASFPDPPFRAAVKVFRNPNDAEKEKLWYSALQKADVKLPQIYSLYGDNCLVTEYICGGNASRPPSGCNFTRIGKQAAADIAKLHSCRGTGYGQILSEADLGGGRYPTWRECYKNIASRQFLKIENAARGKLFSKDVPLLLENVFARFDGIFGEPEYPALVHGDLNAENIMINSGSYLCMIDPINSMWGDPEYELFQLRENGGDRYNLLQNYAALRPLSQNFELKSACYAAFAEAEWYADIGRAQDALLNRFMANLVIALDKYFS